MFDPYLANLLAFGIEGEDYEVESNQTTGGVVANWQFDTLFARYADYNESNDGYLTVYNELMDSASVLSYLGFIYEPTDEMEKIMTDVYNIIYSGFDYSDYTDAEILLSDMEQALIDAGIEDLITDINAQYSEWEAAR